MVSYYPRGSVLNAAIILSCFPGHELVGEGLSAEDVDGPGVVVGDEPAAAGAGPLRLLLLLLRLLRGLRPQRLQRSKNNLALYRVSVRP